MIAHPLYYQLAVVGLLWLCIMLHGLWPSRGALSLQAPAEAVPPQFKSTCANEPQPVEESCPSLLRIILSAWKPKTMPP
jgi:hypothetical protein